MRTRYFMISVENVHVLKLIAFTTYVSLSFAENTTTA